MSRSPANHPDISETPLAFKRFWLVIADQLGPATLMLDASAKQLSHFLTGESYHREVMREVVLQSFTACECETLDDHIDLNRVLDVLGEAAHRLQGHEADDLLDIELLEEVAFIISNHYAHHIRLPERQYQVQHISGTAKVVSLSNTRIQRANQKL